LSLIPLLWAAFRFGQRGAATATLALCGFALWGTLHERGPFVTPDINLSLLLLQSFIGTSAVTVLIVAAMVAQSRRAEEHLRAENAQRKEAEQAREQGEERFRLAASSDALTLYEQDSDLRYTWLYPLHPEHDGALGKTDADMLPEEDALRLMRYKREVMSSGVSQDLEFCANLTTGARHYAMSICPRCDSSGAIIGVAGSALDITQRVCAEQNLQETQLRLAKANEELEARVQERTASLRAALEQMEEFSYTISHDLRAPLRGMQAYSNALLEDHGTSLAPEAVSYVERISRNAARLDKMILDVLTFSRIARAEIQLERVSLNRLIAELVQNYPAMQPPRAKIEILPLHDVLAHEPSLIQVLSNLLGNAVKFVAPGVQPHVRVTSERANDYVTLSVQDNGIGIPPAYQHRLFNMFERIHPDLEYEGNGVGLGIVKKAVERMGGRVGIESDGATGSRFWIEVRAAD
jgi:signal transduction histidine kinase